MCVREGRLVRRTLHMRRMAVSRACPDDTAVAVVAAAEVVFGGSVVVREATMLACTLLR
jgi:hypothetical protein